MKEGLTELGEEVVTTNLNANLKISLNAITGSQDLKTMRVMERIGLNG